MFFKRVLLRNAYLPFSIQMPVRWRLNHKPVKGSIYIPWWAVLSALDISNTMLIKEVAWATCQCIPVPWDFCGGTLITSVHIKFIIKGENRPSNVDDKVSYGTMAKVSWWERGEHTICHIHKLFVAPNHWAPPPPGIYGFASNVISSYAWFTLAICVQTYNCHAIEVCGRQ